MTCQHISAIDKERQDGRVVFHGAHNMPVTPRCHGCWSIVPQTLAQARGIVYRQTPAKKPLGQRLFPGDRCVAAVEGNPLDTREKALIR